MEKQSGHFRGLLPNGGGSLALAIAKIIELGATDGTAFLHLDFGDAGGMKREHTLDTLSKADTTDGKIGIDPRSLPTDHDAGIFLDTLLVTLDNPGMNTDGITHLKGYEVGFELLFFDGGDNAHVRKVIRN